MLASTDTRLTNVYRVRVGGRGGGEVAPIRSPVVHSVGRVFDRIARLGSYEKFPFPDRFARRTALKFQVVGGRPYVSVVFFAATSVPLGRLLKYFFFYCRRRAARLFLG